MIDIIFMNKSTINIQIKEITQTYNKHALGFSVPRRDVN